MSLNTSNRARDNTSKQFEDIIELLEKAMNNYYEEYKTYKNAPIQNKFVRDVTSASLKNYNAQKKALAEYTNLYKKYKERNLVN